MIWMQQNRKELEAAFLQDAPAWNVIASYLGDSGIMNGDGKPPTAASARSAWVRIKAAAKVKARGSDTPAAQVSEPVRAAVPAAPLPPMPTVPRQDSKAVVAALLSRGQPTGFRKPEPKDE